MKFEELIWVFYIIPLVLCIRAFQVSSENYDRLPDRIPIHFNLKGQPDSYWNKGIHSVYLMPVVGLVTLLTCVIIMYYVVYRGTGAPTDDFNVAMFLFTFSLVYLMYKVQIGIIRYALEEIKSIWPYVGWGFAALTLASILFAIVPFVSTKASVTDAVMCPNVDGKTPVDIRDSFTMKDQHAVLHLNLFNIKRRHRVVMEWIDPRGNKYFTDDRRTPRKAIIKNLPWWSYINIHEAADKIIPGRWRVDVSIDGEKVLTREFTISQ